MLRDFMMGSRHSVIDHLRLIDNYQVNVMMSELLVVILLGHEINKTPNGIKSEVNRG